MAVSRAKLKELLSRLEKPVQKAFADAIKNAQSRAQIAALEKAVVSGDIDTVLQAAGVRDAMWSPLNESIRAAFAEGGKFALGVGGARRLKAEFDINNPRAENWLLVRSSQRVTGFLMPEQRAAIQAILQNGMVKGANPRTTALDIVGRIGANGTRTGGVIGLTEEQTQWVLNMGDDIDDLNWERYQSRALRDKRYDSVMKRAFLNGTSVPAETRLRMIESYENRMKKYRGDTIGRTETMRAINESADEALRQVVEDGLAPASAVSRIWRHSFSPNERPGHVKMDGDVRGLGEYFTNPDTQIQLMYPNDPNAPASETINCRCYTEQQIDFAAVERAA